MASSSSAAAAEAASVPVDNSDTLSTPTNDTALPSLLKALSESVVAAHSLPLGEEFSFQASFPEFASALSESQGALLQVINSTLQQLDDNADNETSFTAAEDDGGSSMLFDDFYDPAVWERCNDICEYLLDQLETTTDQDNSLQQQLLTQARSWTQKSQSQMLSNLVEMEKPQLRHEFWTQIQNSRTDPFVPSLTCKPNALEPLEDDTDISLWLLNQKQPGHGLETRFPIRASAQMSYPEDMVAPAYHMPHVYQAEIEQLVYRDWQLQIQSSQSQVTSGGGGGGGARIPAQPPGSLTATWIDTVPALEQLVQELLDEVETGSGGLVIAMDVEAHSWRSFSGLVCLIQLSYRKSDISNSSSSSSPSPSSADNKGGGMMIHNNYLIDALKLRSHVHLLLPITTHPDIVKVLHGADSDVLWLQRDFGLYLVNLFDTGRAARLLNLPSASYAHLLQKYVGITANKTFQLADWRQRPLPDPMQEYAIQDTHYLLDIYECLKTDLETPERVIQVLDASKLVCLSRYAVEPFYPTGYKSLISHRSTSSSSTTRRLTSRQHQQLDKLQEGVLARLWDWRDATARLEDENLNYVCPKASLLRLALACPTNLRTLQSLFHPMPPLVLKYAQDVLDIIKEETTSHSTSSTEVGNDAAGGDGGGDAEEEVVAWTSSHEQQQPKQSVGAFPSSAFLALDNDALRSNNAMSPVLGTEALYRQAGWMTPFEKQQQLDSAGNMTTSAGNTSTSSTGEEDDPHINDIKPNRFLSVHLSNRSYQARSIPNTKISSSSSSNEHNIELGDGGVGRAVDGMGTVRAAMRESSPSDSNALLEEELKLAKSNSWNVRNKLKGSLPSVLGLVTPTIDVDDDDALGEDGRGGRESRVRGDEHEFLVGDENEDFVIPRSMREIYKISNRNRRNKKAGSPTPERGVTPTSEKEREELAQAEALLKEKGLLHSAYFEDSSGSPGKRPRTKTASGRDSEESVPQESVAVASREEDLDVIKAVGWLPEGATLDGSVANLNDRESSKQSTFGYDYSAVGPIGALDPNHQPSNPFFSGAALAGGPLTQGFTKSADQRPKKPNPGRGKQQNRRQERPEKKDGKTHTYRKR